jgi:hypothetical protein
MSAVALEGVPRKNRFEKQDLASHMANVVQVNLPSAPPMKLPLMKTYGTVGWLVTIVRAICIMSPLSAWNWTVKISQNVIWTISTVNSLGTGSARAIIG